MRDEDVAKHIGRGEGRGHAGSKRVPGVCYRQEFGPDHAVPSATASSDEGEWRCCYVVANHYPERHPVAFGGLDVGVDRTSKVVQRSGVCLSFVAANGKAWVQTC